MSCKPPKGPTLIIRIKNSSRPGGREVSLKEGLISVGDAPVGILGRVVSETEIPPNVVGRGGGGGGTQGKRVGLTF